VCPPGVIGMAYIGKHRKEATTYPLSKIKLLVSSKGFSSYISKGAKHATLFSRVNAYLADFPLPTRDGLEGIPTCKQ
jgi:hypothetical protein